MKKIAIIAALLLAALLITSCGFVDVSSLIGYIAETGDTNGEGINLPDFAAIFNGSNSDKTVWGMMGDSVKQKILEAAKENGYEAFFDENGNLRLTDENGNIMWQDFNGLWNDGGEESGDENNGEYTNDPSSAEWPDNEFTKLLPRPEFKISSANTESGEFTVVFSGVTVEQIRKYTDKVRSKGFDIDPELQDEEIMGTVIYLFRANNGDGYTVDITFASGMCNMVVTKSE